MRVDNTKSTLLFISIFFVIMACEKVEDLSANRGDFFYFETYCADPWQQNDIATDEGLKLQVSKFLNNVGIEFNNLQITHDGNKQNCFACSCTSGRVIRFESDLANQDILLEKRFQME